MRLIIRILFPRIYDQIQLTEKYFNRIKGMIGIGSDLSIRMAYAVLGVDFPFNKKHEVKLIRDKKVIKWYVKYGNSWQWVSQKQFASGRTSRYKPTRRRRNRKSLKT